MITEPPMKTALKRLKLSEIITRLHTFSARISPLFLFGNLSNHRRNRRGWSISSQKGENDAQSVILTVSQRFFKTLGEIGHIPAVLSRK